MLKAIFKNRSRESLKGLFFNQVDIATDSEWVKIVPVGDFPLHPNGAHIVEKKHIKEMAANFNNTKKDLLFDYEHDSVFGRSKAAGWSPEVEAREDGLYCKYPDFTPTATRMIEDREFRYFSPGYRLNRQDKKGKEIGAVFSHVGLTNIPYMDNEIDHIKNSNIEENEMKFSKEFLAKLGLAEDASQEEVEAKINSMQEAEGAEKGDGSQEAGSGSLETGTEASESVIARTEEVLNAINNINTRLDGIDKKDVEAVVNAAVTDYRILAKDKDLWLNSFKTDYAGTLERLNAVAKGSVKPGKVNVDADGKNKPVLNAEKSCADFFKTAGRYPQVQAQS